MLIRCPECRFEREINPDTISSTAVRATCPHCHTKFYFRHADGSFIDFASMDAPIAQVPPMAQEAKDATSDRPSLALPTEKTPESLQKSTPPQEESLAEHCEEPLPPGAVIPNAFDDTTQKLEPETKSQQIQPSTKAHEQDSPNTHSRTAASDDSAPQNDFLAHIEREPAHDEAETFIQPGDEYQGYGDTNESPNDKASNIPWENPEKYGFFTSFYQTVMLVLFYAPRFFTALPQTTAPWIRPVSFYIIMGMFQTAMERIWYFMSFQAMGSSVADPKVQELLGSIAQDGSLALTLLFAPITLMMQLGLYASLLFIMLRLVQPEHVTFALVIRIISYSAAPAVICVVPLVGTIVNVVWFAVCCCVGCKYALNMKWDRVFLALGPLYLVAFAVFFQFMRQLLG